LPGQRSGPSRRVNPVRAGLRYDAHAASAARPVFHAMVMSARDTSDARVGPLSRWLRPTARSLTLGIVVAATLIGAETLLVYLLEQIAPGMAFGVVYLLGVLVISTGWGFGLAVTTSVTSALAFDYFHVQPGSVVPDSAADV